MLRVIEVLMPASSTNLKITTAQLTITSIVVPALPTDAHKARISTCTSIGT